MNEVAKNVAVKFNRPDELPTEVKSAPPTMEIRRLHEYYSHRSVNEMKRMAREWFRELEITSRDIEIWLTREGKLLFLFYPLVRPACL